MTEEEVLASLSVQLYSLRRIARLEDQLALVRAAGLSHVEATTANYADPARFRHLLDENGLTAPSGHVGIDRLRGDLDATVALARTIGMRRLVLWGLPEGERPFDAEGWRGTGGALAAVARSLAGSGIALAFHNHDWEYVRMQDGAYALDHLFEGAAGSPLEWQPDLAWSARAGVDVASSIRAREGLIRSAHIKDEAPPGAALDEDGWADLGAGTLPWERWWPMLDTLGVEIFVLEHDEPNDPERFLRTSAARARSLAKASNSNVLL